MAHIDIREIEPEEHPDWISVLSAAPEGSAYLHPGFLKALASATDADYKLLGIYDGQSNLVGGAGLYITDGIFRPVASSRLMLYYNGPFIKPPESQSPCRREAYRQELLQALESDLRRRKFEYIRFKAREPENDYRPFIGQGWQAVPIYSYCLDLADTDVLWRRMDKNLKRLVKRAADGNLKISDNGSFDAFYGMHAELHERKGSPLYLEKERFRQFVGDLAEAGIARIFDVSLNSGKPIAAQLVLTGPHPVAHVLAAGSDPEYHNTGCNPYLRWKVSEWLSREGFSELDLTDAQNLSVARFKRSLGSRLTMGLQLTLGPSGATRLAYSLGSARDRGHAIFKRAMRGVSQK